MPILPIRLSSALVLLTFLSFRPALFAGPPSISPRQASSISATEATFSGTASAGANHTIAFFEYGLDNRYGNIAGFTTLSSTNTLEMSVRIGSITDLPGIYQASQIVQGDRGMAPTACSADGTRIVMAEAGSANGGGGYLYTSPDSGATWLQRNVWGYWKSLACSADGFRIVAVENPGRIHVSLDGGLTWAKPLVPPHAEEARSARNWQSVACSADGMRLVAVAKISPSMPEEGVYRSSDGGTTWVRTVPFVQANYAEVASSADGWRLVMGGPSLHTFVSANRGETWLDTGVPYGRTATSGSGSTLMIAVTGGTLHLSRNGGLSWTTPLQGLTRSWSGVVASYDGSVLAASYRGTTSDGIFLSTDGGSTWTEQQLGFGGGFYSLAASVDGTHLLGGGGNYNFVSFSGMTADLLPNTTYHFRMVAYNREGTARGPDMTFTTSAPSAPFVTTLPTDVTGATEASLQAEIRPNGLATVGYFDYGLDAGYGMTTPNFEFPAERGGNISLRIGSADDTPVGVDWVARSNTPSSWQAIASSADGMRLVAVPATFGKIHTSEDGGQTWVPRDVDRDWASVASSSDGLRLVAVEYRGWIYTSSDGGVTWGSAKSTPVSTRWSQVASSADGSRLVLVVNGGGIYTSEDGGLAWMQQPGAPSSYWYAVASSADGLRLVAAPNGGYIHVSRDGGKTWSATESNRGWRGVASSADGMHLAAAAWPSALMVSSNGGVTWEEGNIDTHPLDAPSVYRSWSAIAASADGLKLVAAEYSGRIYTSKDGGFNWVAGIGSPVAGWKSLASSADGSRLAAAALSKPIYTSAFSGGFTADLRPNTTYHYRVVGSNGEGSSAGEDLTFTTDAAAPDIRMPTPREVTGAGATLTAMVNPGGLSSTGYFEYGPDSGYGNRTEPVSLPAGTGWVQMSAPISGLLPLDTYHYRWVGTNQAGPSTGADMVFTTPKPPSLAIPVAADLTANSAILTGEINPNAAATVGYFEYGADANYGSIAGFTPLPTGIKWDESDGFGPLASETNWMALTARINSLSGPAGEAWSPLALASANWSSLASSADGNKLVAVAYGGGIHTSTDGGSTWTPRTNAPTAYWQSVASSADGARLVALDGGFRLSGGGRIYTSTDGGANWVARTQAPAAAWRAVASSADGSRLVALAYAGGIYFSMDRGETWSRGIGAPEIYWSSVAASADGLRFVAVGGGRMYFSENGGTTWTQSHTAPAVDWLSVAASADGMKLVAGVNMGGIYTSTDHGETWTRRTSAPAVGIWALGSSADGNRLVAVSYRGRIYTSTDSGVTWVLRESQRNWQCIAMSVDGTRLIAGDYAGALYMSSGPSTPFQPGTSYHCRIVGINQEGTVFGEDMAFRTIGTAPRVTTLAATEVDATLQARLNGSVVPNGTDVFVYFEYGLDTNYGFSTPTNAVAGEAGPQPVSFVISGLSARTTYHYRLAAVSAGGLSRGADLFFETPSFRSPPGTEKPAAATEPVTATENRVRLNGNVHPKGLETLVYFQIGEDTDYGRIVGRRSLAGDLQETAIIADLTSEGAAAETLWGPQAGAPVARWQAVASSADGNHILAAAFGGRLYTSADGGSTWTARDSERLWRCVASSADGDKLFAAEYGGGIYTSLDGGFTWTVQGSAPNEYWERLVASADGMKLVAASAGSLATSEFGNGQVYTSSDGGVTWMLSETSPLMQWTGLAISSDGNEVVGCGIDESGVGGLYRSTDGGQSWAATLDTPAGVWWRSVASSADGTKLVALVGGFLNGIYTSADGSVTWVSQPGAPDANWASVASSADGMTLVAVAEKSGLGVSPGGLVYLSSDGGVTWILQEDVPAAMWRSVASSADGTKLVAVEDGDEAGGLIYTYGGSVTMPFLVPGRTYHYRLVASNSAGTTLGQDLTFSTAVNNRVQVVPQATTVVPGGGFLLSFTGDPGLSFTVLMSPDAGLPLEQWSELGQPVEYPPGTYQFLDEEGGDGVRFYRVSSP